MKEIILFAHPTFGVLGIIMAVWVFVEALNASAANASRLRLAAYGVTVFIAASWILGGYWYVNFYGAEKAVILAGPWPWAHSFYMETKEHLFFIPLILALFLPIAARGDIAASRPARVMVLTVAALIALSGLAVEGAGAVINYGAKVALAAHTGA
jgi:hypothetical protein